jgi:hypothetical protein
LTRTGYPNIDHPKTGQIDRFSNGRVVIYIQKKIFMYKWSWLVDHSKTFRMFFVASSLDRYIYIYIYKKKYFLYFIKRSRLANRTWMSGFRVISTILIPDLKKSGIRMARISDGPYFGSPLYLSGFTWSTSLDHFIKLKSHKTFFFCIKQSSLVHYLKTRPEIVLQKTIRKQFTNCVHFWNGHFPDTICQVFEWS